MRLLLPIITFFILPAHASLNNKLKVTTSEKAHLRYYPKSVLKNEIVYFRPIKNFYINLDAPNSCGIAKELEVSKNFVKCQFQTAGNHTPSIYVCDENKTVCVIEKPKISLKGLGFKTSKDNRSRLLHFRAYTSISPNKAIDGFIHNDLEKAQEIARKQNKQILVHTTQQYCATCILVKDYVISDPKFAELTKNYVLVQFDYEIDKYNKLKKKWGLKYTPYFLIVDSDFNEIAQRYGFLSLNSLKEWLRYNKAFKGKPIADLERKFSNREKLTDQELERLTRNKFLGLKKYMPIAAKIQNQSSEIQMIKEFKAASQLKGLERLKSAIAFMKRYPNYERAFELIVFTHRNKENKQKNKEAEKYYKTAIDLKKSILKSQPNDFINRFNLVYLTRTYAQFLLEIESKKESDLVIADALSVMKGMAMNGAQKKSEGMRMFLAEISNSVGKSQEARNIYNSAISDNPNNFSFEYLNALQLSWNKKYDDALKELEKSEKKAKGKQWIQVKTEQIKLLIKTKRLKEAKAEVDKQLSEIRLPESPHPNVHSFMYSLRWFERKLLKSEML